MYHKAPIVSDNVSNKDYIVHMVHLVSIKFQPQGGSDKDTILTRKILNFSSAIMALLDMVEKQQIFITKTLQLKPQREQNNDKGQRDFHALIAANTLAQTRLTEAKNILKEAI